jgi:hypothetical protein
MLAASTLRLKGAAHFVAIDGACKSQCQGSAASLHLHVKGNVVSIHTTAQRRRTPRALKRAAQLGTILLDLHCGLLRAIPALPRNLPGPTETSGPRLIRSRILRHQNCGGKKTDKSNQIKSFDQVSLQKLILLSNHTADLQGVKSW